MDRPFLFNSRWSNPDRQIPTNPSHSHSVCLVKACHLAFGKTKGWRSWKTRAPHGKIKKFCWWITAHKSRNFFRQDLLCFFSPDGHKSVVQNWSCNIPATFYTCNYSQRWVGGTVPNFLGTLVPSWGMCHVFPSLLLWPCLPAAYIEDERVVSCIAPAVDEGGWAPRTDVRG